MGSGNRSDSRRPSGRGTPHKLRPPAAYVRQAWPDRYPRMTISTLIGSALWPTVTRGSGDPIRQLGTRSDVASKKYPAI